MAEEKKLRETFPKGVKAPSEKERSGSVGELGSSLKQNDPETLKFVGRHKVKEFGDKPKVATKHSLEDPKNARLKGHGKDKEESVYEGLSYGKGLRESTTSNIIAMDILEARKAEKLNEKKFDQVARKMISDPDMSKAPSAVQDTGGLRKKEIFRTIAGARGGTSSLGQLQGTYKDRVKAKKAFGEEIVKLSNKQDTGDKEFTKGMEVNKKAEGEIQTGHKPSGPASNKTKKLKKNVDENSITEEDKMHKTMHEFKYGKLHSGSKKGPIVKSRKQAVAIGLNQQRKNKTPVKEDGPTEPIRLGKGVPNKYQNTSADTAYVI